MKQDRYFLAAVFLCSSVVLAADTSSTAAPVSTETSDVHEVQIFAKLAKKWIPSVVNIATQSRIKTPYGKGAPDQLFKKFFEDFFGQNGGRGHGFPAPDDDDSEGPPPPPRGGSGPKAQALGTGFIIEPSGLILTNNHVVADADEIKVIFTEDENEKPTDAEIVGRDTELDLALIKVKTSRSLQPVILGDSDVLEVGEYVIAIGNPFGQGHSVTHGIISAKGRKSPDVALASYLQTDAPINPGNSGGPLMNLKGEVIGINNAIDARAQGIGFAIPINFVKRVLTQLKTKGTVARGYIGILVNELTPELSEKLGIPKSIQGPIVAEVYSGEPADGAGIKVYDIVLEFNGKKIKSPADLIGSVTSVDVGQTVTVKLWRSGKEKNVQIKVAERPGRDEFAKRSAPTHRQKEAEKKKQPKVDAGMDLQNLSPEIVKELGLQSKIKGVVIEDVKFGLAADKAGLERGDVIVEVDRKPITDIASFQAIVKEKKSYLLRVRRADSQGKDAYSVIILDLRAK